MLSTMRLLQEQVSKAEMAWAKEAERAEQLAHDLESKYYHFLELCS
jgi:hypothetical protein